MFRTSSSSSFRSRREPSASFKSRASTSSSTMVRVVAPATLQEGYTFDVLVHGQPLTVTVPPGGMEQGEEFDIPIPIDEDEDDEQTLPAQPSSSSERQQQEGEGRYCSDDYEDDDEGEGDGGSDDDKDAGTTMTVAPLGAWRHHLCSCCDVLTQATFWMGFICTPILMAQLLTRLRLNWKGQKDSDEEEVSLSFNRIVISLIAVLLLGYIPVVGFLIIFVYLLTVVVWIGKNARLVMRRKYKILPTTPIECIDDCLCMCFCGCCSAIQMARQTHNDKEYPGYCCTTTGLEPQAPPVIV